MSELKCINRSRHEASGEEEACSVPNPNSFMTRPTVSLEARSSSASCSHEASNGGVCSAFARGFRNPISSTRCIIKPNVVGSGHARRGGVAVDACGRWKGSVDHPRTCSNQYRRGQAKVASR